MRPKAAMAVKLKFDAVAVVQSLLPPAADVLLNPIRRSASKSCVSPHQFWYSARRT
jgi:hypothetical protein